MQDVRGYMVRARSAIGDRYFMVAIADRDAAETEIRSRVGEDEIVSEPLPGRCISVLFYERG
jgi:hypothetical protein